PDLGTLGDLGREPFTDTAESTHRNAESVTIEDFLGEKRVPKPQSPHLTLRDAENLMMREI
ncbi:hypothetical protein D7X55_40445, partial [Corallococcus sp. AB049A]|uniref:hypothetical protein n=1 Tax=Corallococcus sp. AB049A TaxID=2316721 RepID=UPI000EDD7E6C